MIDPRTPVLVGVAQFVDRDSLSADALSPLDLLAAVSGAALADSGGRGVVVDTLAVVRLFADSSPAFRSPFGSYANLPKSLAARLGQAPRRTIYGPVGGNTPQLLVNLLAESIRSGASDVALIAGGEALRTQARAQKMGLALDWSEDPGGEPETLGPETRLVSAHEVAHGIAMPTAVYPLFESALAAHYGDDPLAHRRRIGALMAGFTRVAAANSYAALPVERTADELITPTDDNRYIAYPYTKYLCSNMFVDQAAALLLMSTAAADAAGVPVSARVYLHGSADVHDMILVSQRLDYHSSPAIRAGAAQALAQAGIGVAELDHIDLYSCFPVAVEIAADMIGLAHDDPRGLTLTGGLPYFGGPGNAYSLHAIAEMAARCHAAPGSKGLVFANGGYLTKHSFGVYSTDHPANPARIDPTLLQAALDAAESPPFVESPAGAGTVEAITIPHERGIHGPATVIVRLDSGHRALAVIDTEAAALIDTQVVGRRVNLTPGHPINHARFE
ncbi:acetyl-CoA acetyltransferase [Glacieibacterium sp.]|uniref:acetyl-CoA acetyltransferase n=1 Tax=Glacieibacterium sp. TaxID=2860237 RepID=UPI003B00D09A